jgi:hypothetical protein
VNQPSYSGLDLPELLKLEAELCTPLKRAEWIGAYYAPSQRYGREPVAVLAALLEEVLERTLKKMDLDKNDLAPMVEGKDAFTQKGKKLETAIYNLFNPNRIQGSYGNLIWRQSRLILEVMLLGPKGLAKRSPSERKVANEIIGFFFPDDSFEKLPPPFFSRERTESVHPGWPHDDAESRFYTVSLARKHHQKGGRVRWFMASGGDLLRGLTGNDSFYAYAERLTAALCFDLEFTFVVPETAHRGQTIKVYLDALKKFWASGQHLETLRYRYPELNLQSINQIDEIVRANMRVEEITMSDGPRGIDPAKLSDLFPFSQSFFKASATIRSDSQVYAPVFLNPWLRFHWADLVSSVEQRFEPQYAAIAFNDSNGKTNLVLPEPPDSMNEFLKWLSVFVPPRGQPA